jgi:hypothetical protein
MILRFYCCPFNCLQIYSTRIGEEGIDGCREDKVNTDRCDTLLQEGSTQYLYETRRYHRSVLSNGGDG